MSSGPIRLTIEMSIRVPEPCSSEFRDTLASDKVQDYLHDCLCDWLWRYMPAELVSFDLAVGLTAAQ